MSEIHKTVTIEAALLARDEVQQLITEALIKFYEKTDLIPEAVVLHPFSGTTTLPLEEIAKRFGVCVRIGLHRPFMP